tara:strand:+ start:440 stop:1207 length:768 start_codon:yes stop_codon:yes gene_type:complete
MVHRMGFEVHSEENPDYVAKLTVWEWSRFLDMLLYVSGAIKMETMLNNIIHINLLETKALTHGHDPDKVANLDITEHKSKIEVSRDEDTEVNRMEIIDTDLPDGRKLFVGASVAIRKDASEEVEQYLAEMAAVSIGAFQHIEDKMFAARGKIPKSVSGRNYFRELGRNGTLLQGDEIWAIYDCLTNFLPPGFPDMLRETMFPKKKRVVPKLTKKQSEALQEFIQENIQPHDIANWPRLFGVLSQTLANQEKLCIS